MMATTTTVFDVEPHPARKDLELVGVCVDGERRQVVCEKGLWTVGQRGVYAENGRFVASGGVVDYQEYNDEGSQGVLLSNVARLPAEDDVDMSERVGFVEDERVTRTKAFMAKHGGEPLTITAREAESTPFVLTPGDPEYPRKLHPVTGCMLAEHLQRVWGHWFDDAVRVDGAEDREGNELSRKELMRAFGEVESVDIGKMLRPKGSLPRIEKRYHELKHMLETSVKAEDTIVPWKIIVTAEDGEHLDLVFP